MAINVKDPATDALARELAALTGESLTTAVRRSIEERHARVQRARSRSMSNAQIMGIIERAKRLPRLDETPSDQYLYGEDGLPS